MNVPVDLAWRASDITKDHLHLYAGSFHLGSVLASAAGWAVMLNVPSGRQTGIAPTLEEAKALCEQSALLALAGQP